MSAYFYHIVWIVYNPVNNENNFTSSPLALAFSKTSIEGLP